MLTNLKLSQPKCCKLVLLSSSSISQTPTNILNDREKSRKTFRKLHLLLLSSSSSLEKQTTLYVKQEMTKKKRTHTKLSIIIKKRTIDNLHTNATNAKKLSMMHLL